MWLAQSFGTLLFLLQDLQLFQVMLPILLNFAAWCQFWSVFPEVFNSCPNTLLLISLLKLPWTSDGPQSGQQWTVLKIATGNCRDHFGCSGPWFCPRYAASPADGITDVSAWKLAAYKLTLFSVFMLLLF